MDDVELLKNLEDAYRRVCMGGFDRDILLAEIERLEREANHRFDQRIQLLSRTSRGASEHAVQ